MEVVAFTPGQPNSQGLCGKANRHCYHPATLFWPLCSNTLWTQGIFFSRIALLFNFEYYIQWLLWGELRHEELEQSLCWRIFSCSFDVLSCCCSQLYYEENNSLQIVRQSNCRNKIPTFDKHCNLTLAGWHHLFALLQAENYLDVRYCTWIRLWTFKPPCN